MGGGVLGLCLVLMVILNFHHGKLVLCSADTSSNDASLTTETSERNFWTNIQLLKSLINQILGSAVSIPMIRQNLERNLKNLKGEIDILKSSHESMNSSVDNRYAVMGSAISLCSTNVTDLKYEMIKEIEKLASALVEVDSSVSACQWNLSNFIMETEGKSVALEQRIKENSETLEFFKDDLKQKANATTKYLEKMNSTIANSLSEFRSYLSNTTEMIRNASSSILTGQEQWEEMNNTIVFIKDHMLMQPKERNCKDMQNQPTYITSGVYSILLDNLGMKNVYCDMDTDGGGWTVIQRRIDGATDFYKSWAEYKEGFGSPGGEHWIGNQALHYLTSEGNMTMYIKLLGTSAGSNWVYAKYTGVKVDSEANKYRLTFKEGSYSGNAGNRLNQGGPGDHNNQYFSTYDRDNDRRIGSCADIVKGGWWFNDCEYGCLNCKYLASDSRWGSMDVKSSWIMLR